MTIENVIEIRHLEMTRDEEEVLVQMVMFFNDMGWIDDSTQGAYDTLFDKITDPEPSDYSFFDKEQYRYCLLYTSDAADE